VSPSFLFYIEPVRFSSSAPSSSFQFFFSFVLPLCCSRDGDLGYEETTALRAGCGKARGRQIEMRQRQIASTRAGLLRRQARACRWKRQLQIDHGGSEKLRGVAISAARAGAALAWWQRRQRGLGFFFSFFFQFVSFFRFNSAHFFFSVSLLFSIFLSLSPLLLFLFESVFSFFSFSFRVAAWQGHGLMIVLM
jgi:hypothetical protein